MKTLFIKTLFTFLLLIQVVSFAYSQMKIYGKNAGKYEDERITIVEGDRNPGSQGAALIAALAPAVIKGGLDIYKNILKGNEAKFSAIYTGSFSDEEFFDTNRNINLPDLNLETNHDGNTSLTVVFVPEYALNNQIFKYRIKEITMFNSKAKANMKDKIDFQFIFTLSGLIVKDGKSSFEEIVSKTLDAKAIPFGENMAGDSTIGMETDFFTIPDFILPLITDSTKTTTLPIDSIQNEAFKNGLTVDELINLNWPTDKNGSTRYIKVDDKNFVKVESKFDKGGIYKFDLTIKEANPCKIKSQNLAKFFEDNSETINNVVDVIVDSTKKKDEE